VSVTRDEVSALARAIGCAVLAVAVAATLTACGSPGSQSSTASRSAVAGASAASRSEPIVSVALSFGARNIAYDPFRNAIWYAVMNLQGPAILYEADSSTGHVKARFTLPDADSTGLSSVVRVAQDESIWVAEPYAIVRVKPGSASVSSVNLPLAVPGALPDALDAGALSPGTWVSAMTLTSDSVLVGRDNVPFLQQWSMELQPEANVALPKGDSGPADMTTTDTRLEIAIPNKTSIETDAGRSVSVDLPNGTSSPVFKGKTALQPNYLTVGQGPNISLQAFSGGSILSVDPTSHVLNWTTTSGRRIQIPWPATSITVHGPPGPGDQTGRDVKTFTEARLLAAVITPAGKLWIMSGAAISNGATLKEYEAG
jgi:hypothetical protein